ncbi:MAG: hypothetical protein Q9210_001833 [Variospora velana]
MYRLLNTGQRLADAARHARLAVGDEDLGGIDEVALNPVAEHGNGVFKVRCAVGAEPIVGDGQEGLLVAVGGAHFGAGVLSPTSVAAKIYWSGFPFGQGLENRLSNEIGCAYVIDNGLCLATASLCFKVIFDAEEVVVAEEQEQRCSLRQGRWTRRLETMSMQRRLERSIRLKRSWMADFLGNVGRPTKRRGLDM